MAMMDVQLNSWLLFEHAPRHFGTTEVVTHLGAEGVHRYTYTDFARRSQQLMHALDQLGIGRVSGWRRSPGTATATSSATSPSRAPDASCTRST